ncbi:hypothetical protein C0W35_22640 [Photobacterium kishitanii]|uniref:DUF4303 domain-containing protein n=1 Tax=Photobacterium kishitanii TaxID=318456 RepID=UPI000D1532EB|nr:DUF4303 domain-containing protein [Photobacterium kishitanii]PSU84434.1 hypothetical protein C0W35_22640 [Photobacterium kishitanii]
MINLDFEKELYSTCENYLHDMNDKFNSICAFALCVDSDFTVISPAFDLIDNYQNNINNDPDDSIYYRWSPAEWSYEQYNSNSFDKFSKLLNLFSSKYNNEEHYKSDIVKIISSVFFKIRVNKLISDKVILSFTITDSSEYDYEMLAIKSGNSDEDYHQFKTWISLL